MQLLVECNYLLGDNAVDAIGWAEERREALVLRQEERAATLPGQDQMVVQLLKEVVMLLKQTVLLVKIVLACLVVLAGVGYGMVYLKK